MPNISETETVVKKILPYLSRRGYDIHKDLTFEYPTMGTARSNLGFVDILVRHAGKDAFLIEAKRIAKNLSDKDRAQAVNYGKACQVSFVVLTNGAQFESINTVTGKRIRWSSKLTDKVPNKPDLAKALGALRKDPHLAEVPLKNDQSLPFRPGLPLKQLNALFARCHNTIRKIEKNEDHSFSDFAKILFLKLLEEKSDSEGTELPYSYRFHELAERPENEADQVRTAILSMLETVRSKTPYGDVIQEQLHLKNARTFRKIVVELAAVSFRDSRTDSKGAAFEYFVRATLKGKKLGQYFTPRPLIDVMHAMVGPDKVTNTIMMTGGMRVVDPACGTGGFLVYFMTSAIERADRLLATAKVGGSGHKSLIAKIRQHTFYGADAHEGVASSAKMNMIIAGDGHSNICCEDSLAGAATVWNANNPDIDLIVTNPPFGTSESETMQEKDLSQFPVRAAKGQMLFLQKMVQCLKPGGEVCTVIDEGLLNTEQAAELRAYLLEHMILRGIVRLPDVTFKPNKINVKSSVLHMIKRDVSEPDLDDDYPVFFADLTTLGYQGSGELIRNLDFKAITDSIGREYHGSWRNSSDRERVGEGWRWFTRSSLDVVADKTRRFDVKYWDPAVSTQIDGLASAGVKSVKELNLVKTRRGKSPSAGLYVDEIDGHALVIKAGSNITRQGTVSATGDFIEKSVFDELPLFHVQDGDILLSSTGDGTLGKCAVFRGHSPAIYDGHVTLIRVNQGEVHPEYVCDYLRAGFGADQIARLFTGSTGLIELPPEHVDSLLIPLPSLPRQKTMSKALRKAETEYSSSLQDAALLMTAAKTAFRTG